VRFQKENIEVKTEKRENGTSIGEGRGGEKIFLNGHPIKVEAHRGIGSKPRRSDDGVSAKNDRRRQKGRTGGEK